MPAPVGIDLGTTFSCVAIIGPKGIPVALDNFDGSYTTPSIVAYSDDGTVVGKFANKTKNIENIIYDSKRFIGRQFDDDSMKKDMKSWPFKVVDVKGKPLVKLTHKGTNKELPAEEISAEVLKMMKMIADDKLNEKVTKAVITVPANFDQRQRHATMEAAKLAGIEVIRLVNEPTAAAIAYGVYSKKMETVLVYDLGGGTFDVSIVSIVPIVKFEGKKTLRTIATVGEKHLGGQDFDIIIRNYVLTNKNFHDFPKNKPKPMKRLLEACTEAKIQLSFKEKATISIDVDDEFWTMELTRSKFEDLCGGMFRGTLEIVNQALRQAKMNESKIDIVILAGGSTRIPMVRNLLKEKFSEKKIWNEHNPDEVVAKGAALVASSFLNASPNDDIQLVFNDIVPLSIGKRVNNDLMYLAIKKGDPYPCKKEQITELSQDNQKSVSTDIYEGQRKQCKYNFKIGSIKLNLKNQNSRRGYEMKTIYEIDLNGLLHVTKVEVENKNGASLVIQYDGCPHKDGNIEDIVAEAKRNKEEDDEFEIHSKIWSEFNRQIYRIKHSTEDDGSMSKGNKEKILGKVNEWIVWADNFSKSMEENMKKIEEHKKEMEEYKKKMEEYKKEMEEYKKKMEEYKKKMEKSVSEIKDYYPSVNGTIDLSKLTRDFQKKYITEME